jgi:pimeloyl-ACP methyl ester carboxylesterase
MTETFVLIPGAWHGGWAWRPVAQRLRAAGHRAVSLTLPGLADGADPRGLTLADAISSVVDAVGALDGEVTLVAHSWGGIPMTGAAAPLRDRVRKLVYWSAFVPVTGGRLLDEAPPEFVGLFDQLAASSADNTLTLPYEVWAENFIQDADEGVRRLVYSLLVPQPYAYFTDPLDGPSAADLDIPATYLFSTEDLVFPPGGEHAWVPRFPDRLGVAHTEVPGSHESLLTRPDELAEAILRA